MKPKLIILNGPCGVGKTTLAEIYKDEHPLTLSLDVDEVRRFIGQYREHREKSHELMYRLAYAMAEEHLKSGYDVVVPNIIRDVAILERFEEIAQVLNVDFYEFVLTTSKEDAIARAVKRGFKPGGLLQADKLETMYDELVETLKKRPEVIQITSKERQVEETYRELIDKLS